MTTSRLRLWVLMVGLGALGPGVAHAECKAPYTSAELVNDLTSSQLSLRNLDESMLSSAAARLEVGLPCVSNPVPPMVFASAYRYIGAYRYLAKDIEGSRRWFRTSLELDASYQWDASELELENPIRMVFESERDSAQTPAIKAEGKVLAQPAGSTYVLDGRPLKVAQATPNRPHILQQVATADRSVRGTWLMDGPAFPAQVLQDGAVAGATPVEAARQSREARKKKPEADTKERVANVEYTDSGAIRVERLRPPEKTPLMIVGTVAILSAGALYAASFVTHDEFEASTTTQQLFERQTMTNALVLSSGGVLLAGLGVGYWGIILDGGAGVGVTAQF